MDDITLLHGRACAHVSGKHVAAGSSLEVSGMVLSDQNPRELQL